MGHLLVDRAIENGAVMLLRPVCGLFGHRWEMPLRTFGRSLAGCSRCGAVRYV